MARLVSLFILALCISFSLAFTRKLYAPDGPLFSSTLKSAKFSETAKYHDGLGE